MTAPETLVTHGISKQVAPRGRFDRRIIWVAIAVTFAHLVMVVGLARIIEAFFPSEPPPPQPISIQLAQAPSPPPPAAASPTPPPAAPAQPAEPTKPSESPSAAPPAPPVVKPAEPKRVEERVPTLEELPKMGGVALNAFWGNFSEGNLVAKGALKLSFPAPDRYQIELVTHAVGWAKLFASAPLQAKGEGRLGPGGFLPDRYTHRTPRGKEEVSTFDYQKEKIFYSSLKEPLLLPKGVQDRLSFMIQLAWMMKVDPERFFLGGSLRIPMAGRNKIEDVEFLVLDDADVVLPGGVLVPAVHLSSAREGTNYKGRIDVWLDKTDRLLPVRIRFEEVRGQVLDLLTVREP